jgi:hypothetical protein
MSRKDLLYRVRRGLAHMLLPEEEQPAPAHRGPAVPEAATERDASANFAARLKKLLAENARGSASPGCICQIGLGKIRARFGSSWDRVAERADRIARSTIERRLTAGDIYAAVDGPAYVIVFARLSEESAKTKCVIMAQQIAKSLVGETGADVLEVQRGSANADGSYSLQELPIDDQFLRTLSAIEHVEVGEASKDHEDKKASPATSTKPSSPAPRNASLTGPAAATTVAGFEELRLSYRPIWDRARNIVSVYLCSGQLRFTEGKDGWWDGATLTLGNAAERAAFDELVLPRALGHIGDLIRENRIALVAVPLHFETVGAASRRRRIAQLLAERVGDAERKQLLIEIDGVPMGVPQARLVDLLGSVRPHCRAVLLRLPADTVDVTNIKGCGAAAVAIDVAEHGGSETKVMQHMNRFAGAAREKGGFRACLLGAHSTSLAVAAFGAGFDYIGGDAIAQPVEHPRGLVEFSVGNIFAGSRLSTLTSPQTSDPAS